MALGVGEAVDEAQFVILVMCTVAQGVGGADKLALAVVVVAPTGTGGVDKLLYLPLWRMAPLVTLPGRIGIQLQLALAIALEALQATARQVGAGQVALLIVFKAGDGPSGLLI